MDEIDNIKKIFAKNLRFYMNEYKLNQNDISKITNVSRQSVSNWLNEKLLPRMGIIEILADHFHILKSDLLEDRDSSVKAGLVINIDFDNDENSNIKRENLLKSGAVNDFEKNSDAYYKWMDDVTNKINETVKCLQELKSRTESLDIPGYGKIVKLDNIDSLCESLNNVSEYIEILVDTLEDFVDEKWTSHMTTSEKKYYLEKMYPEYKFKTDDDIDTLFNFFMNQNSKKYKTFIENFGNKKQD